MLIISDKDKSIIIDVENGRLSVKFGENTSADVIGKLSKATFDQIVEGRVTFHRAFMTGAMTAKGNFRTLKQLDDMFSF